MTDLGFISVDVDSFVQKDSLRLCIYGFFFTHCSKHQKAILHYIIQRTWKVNTYNRQKLNLYNPKIP